MAMELPSSAADLRRLCELRTAAFKTQPLFKDTPYSRNAIRTGIRRNLAQAEAAGKGRAVMHSLRKKGELRALFLAVPTISKLDGKPMVAVSVDLGPKDRAAARWMSEEILPSQSDLFSGATSITLQLLRPFEDLLDAALRAGLHIDSLLLLGHPVTSLRRLNRHYGELEWDSLPNLEVRPLRMQDLGAAMKIYVSEFRRNPQFGWFCGSAFHAAEVRRAYLKAIRAKTPSYFSVLECGKFAGVFGFDPSKQGFFGKPEAGTGLNFSPELQGRGLAKYAYAHMMREMRTHGIQAYIGGTSQPGVIRLGKIMKRPLLGWVLRGGKGHFPRAHFKYPTT